MKRNTTRLWRKAVQAARATIQQLAREAGYSPVMFDLYRNKRPVSQGVVLALADALEARAKKFVTYAERLRAVAGEERAGHSAAPSKPRRRHVRKGR